MQVMCMGVYTVWAHVYMHACVGMNTNVQCMYCACELIPMRVSLFASVFEFLNFFLSIRYMVLLLTEYPLLLYQVLTTKTMSIG